MTFPHSSPSNWKRMYYFLNRAIQFWGLEIYKIGVVFIMEKNTKLSLQNYVQKWLFRMRKKLLNKLYCFQFENTDKYHKYYKIKKIIMFY